MPIYEYQCSNCGWEVEVLQKMSDAPLQTCDKCEKDTMQKKISAAAFRLKGGGWYETDFKTGSKKNLVGEKGSSSSKASDKPDSSKSSDTKKTDAKASSTKASSSVS